MSTLNKKLEEFDKNFQIMSQVGDQEVDGVFAIEADKKRVRDFFFSTTSEIIGEIEGEVKGLRLELPSKDDDSIYPLLVENRNEIVDKFLSLLNNYKIK